MAIHLIRHTSLDVPPGTCYGRLDLDVSDKFESEAKIVKEKIPTNIKRAFCSPSKRCILLAEFLGLTYCIDYRIREMDFGIWEGKLWDEIDRTEMDAWASDVADYRIPNGETFREVVFRVGEFLENTPEEEVILITHAGVIKALRALRGGIDIYEAAVSPTNFGDYISI
tara:strand:+ start:86 stop:592 length:507 start_codon:yes stop_codon:yes gene_type:complete